MLAKPRQIHHEGVLELAVDLLLDAVEIVVRRALGELAAENLLPVRSPFDLLHALAGDQRAGTRGRRGLQLRRLLQMLVVEGEGLVIVVNLGQVGIGEDLGEHTPFGAELWLDLAVRLAMPAAVPAFLVFPVLRVTDAGLGLDIVEPRIFHALAAGPNVLAGDRAGVTADTFVEVQHHRDLGADLHSAASKCLPAIFGASSAGSSSQSTCSILRMMTNSSRLDPTVP